MPIFDILCKKVSGVVRKDEPLKQYTYIGIGGPADVLVIPESIEELRWILTFAREQGVRYFIMGNGTNLIFDDGGYRGLVIKTNACLSRIQVNGESIFAGSGADLMDLILVAADAGLSCLEQLSGIPGTTLLRAWRPGVHILRTGFPALAWLPVRPRMCRAYEVRA